MRFIRIMLVSLAGLLLLAVLTIAIARVALPHTCAVPESALERIELEKMRYGEVKATLGCDGVVVSREDIGGTGELVIEDISWRLDTWPYGRFTAHFINGVAHGKELYALNLRLSP